MDEYRAGLVMGMLTAIAFAVGIWLTWLLLRGLVQHTEPRYLSVCNMCEGACYLGTDGLTLCDKCREKCNA